MAPVAKFERRLDEHLLLRSLSSADSEPLFTLVDSCRAYLREWLPWVDETISPSDTLAFIDHGRERHERGEGFEAGIFVDEAIVGVIGVHRINRANRSTSIGYWLGEGFRGRGIMTRSCRAVVDSLFRQLKLHRIEIHCAVGNAKSRAIPERLGFTIEGTRREAERLYDRYVDLVVYAMLTHEWDPQ